MSKRITLRMIAEKAGVHLSTVSLALNNHPSIPASTRERLEKLAAEMGYRPDPMLSALVSYRTLQRKPIDHGVLAWVDNWPSPARARDHFSALWHGAYQRADSLGWKLEEFRIEAQDVSKKQISQILRSRGIVGVMVAPLAGEGGSLNLDWPRFSAVALSNTLTSPHLHGVKPHQMYNMQLLMSQLSELGYRRPGFTLDPMVDKRTNHAWVAAFLAAQLALPSQDRLPILFQQFADGKKTLDYQKRYRPDVIISTRPAETIDCLKAAGIQVPADVGVVTPAFLVEIWRAGTENHAVHAGLRISGINECFETIGGVAIETLVAMLHRHDCGVPASPHQVLIEGAWVPGDTVTRQLVSADS